jgi:transcriptional regulator with XRE-family HTH domain
MADAVRAALELKNTARTIEWARSALGLSYAEVAGATGASERTVIRWAQQSHPPRRQHRQRIEKLNELRQLLASLFGPNATTAREWLHDAVPSLRGRTPLSLIVQGQIDDVLGALTGLEAAAFG